MLARMPSLAVRPLFSFLGIGTLGLVAALAAGTSTPTVAQQESAAVTPPVVAPVAAAAEPARPSTQGGSRTPVSGLEKINLVAPGFPLITGIHSIEPDGTIPLPGLGRIDVHDKKLGDIEGLVAKEIRRLTGRDALVTVDVVEYKPIFVSGYVARAGSFAWRSGYTVLHAETLSGGVYRPTATDTATPSESERARAHRAAVELANVLASIETLKAIKSGAADLTVPPRLKDMITPEQSVRLMESQRTHLASNRASFESRRQGLERALALGREELEGLQTQKVRVEEQALMRKRNLDEILSLKSKGLIRSERILDERTRLADLDEKLTNILVSVARVKSLSGSIERDIETLQQERISTINAELIRLEQQQSQLEIEVEVANSAYRRLTGSSAFVNNGSRDPIIRYEIVRMDDNKPVAIPATRFTLIQPGDVLVVSLVDQMNN